MQSPQARTWNSPASTFDIRQSHLVKDNTRICGKHATKGEGVKLAALTVDYYGWSYLMKESGLMTFMDAAARDQWTRQLTEGEAPAFTVENIEAVFRNIHAERGNTFERGIVNCFKNLSWDYATNQPFKFGKRVVMKHLCDRIFGYPQTGITSQLADFARAFHILDGKPEPDNRQSFDGAVDAARKEGKTEAENEYFSIRWFKNRNGHLTFKRPDLVEQMNRIIAKHYPHALASEVR
jgi:hypothetical protein